MKTTDTPIRVGPAGWSYADWDGIVYPEKKSPGFDRLEYVASYFDLVEINSTFYRVPTRASSRRWAERVASKPGFLFTVKAPRGITHGASRATASEIDAFKSSIEPILDRSLLGAVLVQFPWSFRPSAEAISYVKAVTDRLRPFPAAVEVRHGDWGAPRIAEVFRENRIALCGIDQPLIGNSLGPDAYVVGPDLAYFRLHGRRRDKWFAENTSRDERYDYLYDEAELAPWSERIRRASAEAPRVFAVLNNHFRGQAVANALELRSMLTGEKARAPRGLLSRYPRVKGLIADGEPEPPPKSGDRGQLELFEKDDHDD